MTAANGSSSAASVISRSIEITSWNLVVEFESRGKPSGISVTEADFYVYFMPKLNEVWNIKMDELKKLIKSNNFKKVSGGDEGSETKMYLIKRNLYKKYFKIHNI